MQERMMKTKFCTLACVLFLMLAQVAYAQCSGCNSVGRSSLALNEKMYVEPNQIAFHDSKIYVQLEENVFIVPAIYSDQDGFYIQLTKQPRGRCEPYEWKCPNPNCGRCNDFSDDTCPRCGTEMP